MFFLLANIFLVVQVVEYQAKAFIVVDFFKAFNAAIFKVVSNCKVESHYNEHANDESLSLAYHFYMALNAAIFKVVKVNVRLNHALI